MPVPVHSIIQYYSTVYSTVYRHTDITYWYTGILHILVRQNPFSFYKTGLEKINYPIHRIICSGTKECLSEASQSSPAACSTTTALLLA
jgi:hypothetical protein